MWEDVSMTVAKKIFLVLGGCLSAILSLYLLICIFGMWFIGPPRDHSVTLAHDILIRAGMTVLFLGISAVLGFLSRLAVSKARAEVRN
jgi:hypothetical protein